MTLLAELRKRDLVPELLARLKSNDCHNPAGSSDGGQFCGDGGGDTDGTINVGQVSAAVDALPKFDNSSGTLSTYGEKDYRRTPFMTEGENVGKLGGYTAMRAEVDASYAHRTDYVPATVSIDKLVSYQNYVSGAKVNLLAQTYDQWKDDLVATVVEHGGKMWIVDGNHRLAAMKLGGIRTAKVELYKAK